MKKTFTLILLALLAFAPMAWAQINYIDANGYPATCTNYQILDDIISAAPNSDKIIGYENMDSWFVLQGSNVVLNGQLGYNGHMNLILCDGAKLTVNNTDGNAIASLDNTETITTLTIYVQEYGTGQLVTNAAIQTENITINGGVISVTSGGAGIYAPSNDIVINGGTVTASAPNGDAIVGYNVTINGGIVSATGNGGIKNGQAGKTILG